ncbi:MAG TPA: hypothetical protein VHZ04_03475 [Candidatus Paceibacterota bacterium]|jgi:hypothetical protein|nr:hypothetical protein [Candidatus Paceibacterota bacterium]
MLIAAAQGCLLTALAVYYLRTSERELKRSAQARRDSIDFRIVTAFQEIAERASRSGELLQLIPCHVPEICLLSYRINLYRENPPLKHWRRLARIDVYLRDTPVESVRYWDGGDTDHYEIFDLSTVLFRMQENLKEKLSLNKPRNISRTAKGALRSP